ncbi:MAG: hypothetical protein HY517_04980 [Candidatus Aenigmarchaeota archaeon]|nr:hypothetical protein [Candidatus Aenigmarchaeota archaeon]
MPEEVYTFKAFVGKDLVNEGCGVWSVVDRAMSDFASQSPDHHYEIRGPGGKVVLTSFPNKSVFRYLM